jgi:tetratricopeptide (TPR) repeat protein
MVLNALGDTEGQRTALEQAIKSDSGYAPAQYQLGYVESRSGDAAGAEQQFRLAVKAAPGYVQAWVALAATLAMESRFPEAQEAVETALKLDPSNQEALDLSKTLAASQAQH